MNDKIIVLAAAVALALLGLSTSVAQDATLPIQGEGNLAQSPLNIGTGATPAFIMAVDDSGSMLFQTMFPGANGEACWSTSSKSFFEISQGQSTGQLRTSGTCNYKYVSPGQRNSTADYGIPPLDTLGFARSPDFNPSYFDPAVVYEPWVDEDLELYPNANTGATRIHPDQTATVDLFSAYESTTWTFRMQNGMVVPKHTEYRTGNSWHTAQHAFTWNAGAQNVAIKHVPGVVYLTEKKPMPGWASGPEIENACGVGCSMWKYEPSNPEAKQNFANWFSFYGNRNRAMIAGMTRALKDVEKLRVGYLTINRHSAWDNPVGSSSERVAMFDMNTASEKKKLYKDSLLKLPASGGTPNLPAVKAAGTQFMRTDKNAPVLEACQKNAVMLFTDGYSNVAVSTTNQDGAMGAPFADNHANTLADIATSFYMDKGGKSPIRPDKTAGRVPVPAECEGASADKRLDCQPNLHVNFYGITLGATGDLFDPQKDMADQDPYTTAAIYNNWPAYKADSPSTIDDIWHATVNTRGRFINATTPADITQAMRNVLSAVSADAGQAGSLAVSGARLGDNSFSVAPSFGASGTDWYGDVTASKLVMVNGSLTRTHLWNAADALPAHGSRGIYFAETTSDSTPSVSPFNAASVKNLNRLCSTDDPLSTSACANVGSLGVSVVEAVDYLRGHDGLEGTKLRTRSKKLGDIVNSTPVVSSPRDNFGYRSLTGNPNGGQPASDPFDYADYMKTKAGRATMVYVGANDGMLHAFDHSNGGESFAYIPATSIGHMGNLLFPEAADFEHRYYVDGPISVSDAYYGGGWHSVLVGTAGAGGRSVFGLQVDNPGSFSGSHVLWEVNDRMRSGNAKTAAARRIGHVTSRPLIAPVRAKNGSVEWKAIFGNGFGSDIGADGTVTLFVVDIGTGAISYIDAKQTSVPTDSSGNIRANGMSSIMVLDRKQVGSGGSVVEGSDGFVDIVYGGDLHGNIWKFDLLESQVALSGQPLFTAAIGSRRQPITGGLEAAVGPRGGVMVLFGTGSFMFENDKVRSEVQSIYGILDDGTAVTGRTQLQAQTVAADTGLMSQHNVNYHSLKGWYLDLDTMLADSSGTLGASGERMFSRPRLDNGTFWFTTFAPSSADPCAGGGSNWMYGVSALTGAGNMSSMLKADGSSLADGTGRVELQTGDSAPVMDVGVFTTSPLGALAQGETESDADFAARYKDRLDGGRCDVIIQAQGGEPYVRPRACGRQSWRQIR